MRIASIGETDRGGAGLSALKLHHEFLAQGLESNFFVNRKTRTEEHIIPIPNRDPEARDNSFRIGCYAPPGATIPFTTGYSCKDHSFLEHVWQSHNVLLLRWSSVSLSDFTVSLWSNRAKPLIWCLSDMAALTGGCHYSMGCDRYQTACNPCPHVGANQVQHPKLVMSRRKQLWKTNLTFVSPSKWLADVARASAIAHDKDIRVIRTGVELDVFMAHDRWQQKVRLGLNPRKPVILFGADSVKDTRKGFRFLPELVEILNNHLGMANQYHVLVVGSGSTDLDLLQCEVTVTGHITSRTDLAKIYSAADVTVLPYIEDNLPNVCLESLACGTPVVAFAIGGLVDVVDPAINGDLARPFDVWDLAHRVSSVIHSSLPSLKIRQWAQIHLDIKQQAREYLNLFDELLARTNATPNPTHVPHLTVGLK